MGKLVFGKWDGWERELGEDGSGGSRKRLIRRGWGSFGAMGESGSV